MASKRTDTRDTQDTRVWRRVSGDCDTVPGMDDVSACIRRLERARHDSIPPALSFGRGSWMLLLSVEEIPVCRGTGVTIIGTILDVQGSRIPRGVKKRYKLRVTNLVPQQQRIDGLEVLVRS